jgi:23S rRNA (uracil1939-C5)-methyltransferase
MLPAWAYLGQAVTIPRTMAKKNIHTVLIEKMVDGGFGLGRLDGGIVVLIRAVLPGEKVVVREISRKKDFIAATLAGILSPSPERVAPPCPLYGRCGGCDLQHASYACQLRLKKAILADTLARAPGGGLALAAQAMENPVAAPEQFGYRQRIRLQVAVDGSFGFFRTGSHHLEPVSACRLARDELNTVLRQLHGSGTFRDLAIRCSGFELLFNPDGGVVILLLHFRRKPRPADAVLAETLAGETSRLGAILMVVEGHGLYDPLRRVFPPSPPALSHTVFLESLRESLTFSWEATGFCQVNLRQNDTLVRLVLEIASGSPRQRILDLYCGAGNFSLPLARSGAEVLGIDSQNSGIRSARRNTERNGIPACRFVKDQVAAGVRTLLAEGRTFDTIILDPPRQGAPDTAPLLPDLGAAQIIYVSCNPPTLARDLVRLTAAGYTVARLVPLDMFPQTHHIETVVLLKR